LLSFTVLSLYHCCDDIVLILKWCYFSINKYLDDIVLLSFTVSSQYYYVIVKRVVTISICYHFRKSSWNRYDLIMISLRYYFRFEYFSKVIITLSSHFPTFPFTFFNETSKNVSKIIFFLYFLIGTLAERWLTFWLFFLFIFLTKR
jgi:hypothetical protein